MTLKRGLDLGGSDVRVGRTQHDIAIFDSKCAEIPVDAPTKDYLEESSNYSDFIIRKHPMTGLMGRRFVRDDVINHYNGTPMYCDNQSVKVSQEITYINAAYALAYSLIKTYDTDVDLLVGACIPTSEFYSDSDLVTTFKSGLTGDFEVYFPIVDKTVRFTINDGDIKVVPEGVVAIYQFSKIKSFREGLTLVVDVGKRSTDITVLKKFLPSGRSAVSRTKGGINIEAFVRGEMERDGLLLNNEDVAKLVCNRYFINNGELEDVTDIVYQCGNDKDALTMTLQKRYGTCTAEMLDQCLNRYFTKFGSDVQEVTPYVVKAKKFFAASLKEDIIDVLSRDMQNLSSVNNIVPMGRPFIGDTSNPNNLVSMLKDELKCKADFRVVPNLGTANVAEIMAVMGN